MDYSTRQWGGKPWSTFVNITHSGFAECAEPMSFMASRSHLYTLGDQAVSSGPHHDCGPCRYTGSAGRFDLAVPTTTYKHLYFLHMVTSDGSNIVTSDPTVAISCEGLHSPSITCYFEEPVFATGGPTPIDQETRLVLRLT